eukprot:4123799-Amphidinium_carterae.1
MGRVAAARMCSTFTCMYMSMGTGWHQDSSNTSLVDRTRLHFAFSFIGKGKAVPYARSGLTN